MRPETSASAEWTRRQMLQAGSIGLLGLSLPSLLSSLARGASGSAAATGGGKRNPAKSCILFFMEGGPSHLDLWDMKPDASSEYRGEFKPISTSADGVQVCEHLPMLAKQMHHVALVRSVHHRVIDHNAGAYYCLTGREPLRGSELIIGPSTENFPPFGAVCAKLRPTGSVIPPFIHLPEIMSNLNQDLPGQDAGFLAPEFEPFVLGDVSAKDYTVPGLQLREEVTAERMRRRMDMIARVKSMDRHAAEAYDALDGFQRRAFDLLTSDDARAAFDLSRESQATRERYGLRDRFDEVEARKFGGMPHMGQCMLMARRLVEAGTRLVTLGSGRRLCQAWDTHRQHFQLLKESLLPYADRAFSALLEDLAERGMLEDTLVVAMGEFGRTPKIGQITSSAGADANGRDHWPHCYTVLFAGGGVKGGTVYGASDQHAAYPIDNPCTPEDIAATIYWAMGIHPEHMIQDRLTRPHPVALGKPITEVFV